MARDDCDWCCNYEEIARNQQTFNAASLYALCGILTNTAGGSGGGDVNLTQIDGTAADVGLGASSPGTLRVAISTDSEISVINFPSVQAISGTVTANAGTGTFNVAGTVAVSNPDVNYALETGGNLQTIAQTLTASDNFDFQPAAIENQGNLAKLVEYNVDPENVAMLQANYSNIEQLSRQMVSSTFLGQDGRHNSVVVSPTRITIPYVVNPSTGGANINVAYQDCNQYTWMTFQISSLGTSSTVVPQVSNDGVTWVSTVFSSSTSINTSTISAVAASATGLYFAPVVGRYARLQVAAPSAGLTIGVVEYLSVAPAMLSTTSSVALAGTSTVTGAKASNSGVPGSNNLGVLPAVANAVPPAVTEGDQVLVSTDLNSSLRVLPQTSVATLPGTYVPGSVYSQLSLNTGGELRVDTTMLRQVSEMNLITNMENNYRVLENGEQSSAGSYGFEFR